jgi:transcriptional regulator with XRE-family HTH domain/mannose-6-phosphate isomerase-like protein (cupin superfamily)
MLEEALAAERIRALRLGHNLTLKQLGERADVTPSQLSRIENRQVNPPVSTLARLARALGVTLGDLFREDQRHTPLVICRGGGEEFVEGGPGFRYHLLANGKRDKLMEPFVLRVFAGGGAGGAAADADGTRIATGHAGGAGVDPARGRLERKVFSHAGQEYMRVLRGRLRFVYEGHEHILQEGDSLYFDSSKAHLVSPADCESVDLLVVITSREYLYSGDVEQLISHGVYV